MGGGGGGRFVGLRGLTTCIGNIVGKSAADSMRARAVCVPRGVVGGGGGKLTGRGMFTDVSDRARGTIKWLLLIRMNDRHNSAYLHHCLDVVASASGWITVLHCEVDPKWIWLGWIELPY